MQYHQPVFDLVAVLPMDNPRYDPQRSEPIEDSDKAYQPCYVAPEPDEVGYSLFHPNAL